MRNIVRFVLYSLFCLGNMCAHAQSDAGTTWYCWYRGDTFVHCRLRSAEPSKKAAVPPVATSDRSLPEIVQIIRDDPGSLKNQSVSIPLHTIPYDMDFVRQLAKSVMCGGQTACAIDFGADLRVSSIQSSAIISR